MTLFSKRFFIERLDRIKKQLIIFGSITTFYGLIIAFTIMATALAGSPIDLMVGILDVNIGIRFFVSVGVPILSVFAFDFLTKRAATDFYMVLPIERRQMAFSAMLAVFVGSAAVVTVSSLLTLIVLMPGVASGLVLDVGGIILEYIALILATLLAVSVSGLAASATGRGGMAIVYSFSVLLLPRIAMLAVNGSLMVLNGQLVWDHVITFFNNEPNLFVALAFFNDGAVLNPLSYIYTLGLSALACYFAGRYFRQRSGEHTGSSFAIPGARHLLRIIIPALVFAVGVLLVCTLDSVGVFFGLMFCLSSFGAYFLTELFQGGRGRGMISALRAFPIYLLVICLNVAVVVGGHFAFAAFSPSQEEIKSVSIVAEVSSTPYWPMAYGEYVLLRSDEARLVDAESRDSVAKALDFDEKTLNNSNIANYVQAVFKIETALGTSYRRLYMPSDEYDRMLLEGDGADELWLDISGEVVDAWVDVYDVTIEGSAALEAVSRLESEVRAAGVSAWHSAAIGSYGESVYITLTVKHGGKLHYVDVPVPDFATATSEYITDIASEMVRERYDDMSDALVKAYRGTGEEMELFLAFSGENDIYNSMYLTVSPDNENAKAIVDFVLEVTEPVYGEYGTPSLSVEVYGSDFYSDFLVYQSFALKEGVTEADILAFFEEYPEYTD